MNPGSTPRSATETDRLTEAGALASIGSVGDSYDNAMAESLIGLYKSECVRRDGPLRTVEDLELVTASWVHWFNTSRLHSMIGNIRRSSTNRTTTLTDQPEKIQARENPASTEFGALQIG